VNSDEDISPPCIANFLDVFILPTTHMPVNWEHCTAGLLKHHWSLSHILSVSDNEGSSASHRSALAGPSCQSHLVASLWRDSSGSGQESSCARCHSSSTKCSNSIKFRSTSAMEKPVNSKVKIKARQSLEQSLKLVSPEFSSSQQHWSASFVIRKGH